MKNDLDQFFTPAWASELLFDAYFSHLTEDDRVWEPSCGTGNMLASIPAHIPAIGTEIDPLLAIKARERSGRLVLCGNFLTVDLPQISAVFGNPPFNLLLFQKLLDRCSTLLSEGNKAGFILPAYFLQTSRTVMALGRKWTIGSEIIPRDLFPSLSKPLVFSTFMRENNPQLIGFKLFAETADIKGLPAESQELLYNTIDGSRSIWRESVKHVLENLGGTASLSDIYRSIEGKRPTENKFWKEKVRQSLQRWFVKKDFGVYSLN